MLKSRGTIVGLILAAAALFVIGILLEHGSEGDEHASASVAYAAETGAESAEESGGEESGEPAEEGSSAGESSEEHEAGEADETVLGIDLESTPFVVLAVLASLGLAALVAALHLGAGLGSYRLSVD